MRNSGKQSNNSITFNQWVKNIETNRFQNIAQQTTLDQLLKYFLRIHPDFLKHSYVKRMQAASFEADKEEVKRGNDLIALLQIDFAENATCEAQDEVQSAHWNQAAV